MTLTEMIGQEQVLYFRIQDELMANRTMDEANAKAYAATCLERARAYAAHLTVMELPPYLKVWATDMAASSGKNLVKAHHNYLPWLAAFLVVRYGEAVEHWPVALTELDLERAHDWKIGKRVPTVVTV